MQAVSPAGRCGLQGFILALLSRSANQAAANTGGGRHWFSPSRGPAQRRPLLRERTSSLLHHRLQNRNSHAGVRCPVNRNRSATAAACSNRQLSCCHVPTPCQSPVYSPVAFSSSSVPLPPPLFCQQIRIRGSQGEGQVGGGERKTRPVDDIHLEKAMQDIMYISADILLLSGISYFPLSSATESNKHQLLFLLLLLLLSPVIFPRPIDSCPLLLTFLQF